MNEGVFYNHSHTHTQNVKILFKILLELKVLLYINDFSSILFICL